MTDPARVPVAVVSSRTEAALIVGLLNSHGVDAAVVADDVGGQEPQLQLEGVHVLVAPGDADVARRLLADEGPGTGPGAVPGASECRIAKGEVLAAFRSLRRLDH